MDSIHPSRRSNVVDSSEKILFCLPDISDDMSRAIRSSLRKASLENDVRVVEIPPANLNGSAADVVGTGPIRSRRVGCRHVAACTFQPSNITLSPNLNCSLRCCRHSHDCAMRESHVNIGFIPEPPQSLQGAPPPYMATPINSYWQPSASAPSPSRIPSAHPVHARTVRCTQCYLERAAAERRLFERRRRNKRVALVIGTSRIWDPLEMSPIEDRHVAEARGC
ncbi:hypothetical protein RB195_011759 [Necator americanus]|uniref:Uncharacterized protein n=1 Tax=Necator americanus TaxID=51031 RepID=A0ABR1D5T4_NECAM